MTVASPQPGTRALQQMEDRVTAAYERVDHLNDVLTATERDRDRYLIQRNSASDRAWIHANTLIRISELLATDDPEKMRQGIAKAIADGRAAIADLTADTPPPPRLDAPTGPRAVPAVAEPTRQPDPGREQLAEVGRGFAAVRRRQAAHEQPKPSWLSRLGFDVLG